jgi:hypothetical protein
MTREERPPDPDRLAEEEAAAAAAEAARIGGPPPDYRVDDDHDDEASRPLEEAGEGEAEGFELAEHDLIEEATHGDERHYPPDDAFPEEDPASAVYGEPDEVDPTEVVRDPLEGEDDPGAGPGVAADR